MAFSIYKNLLLTMPIDAHQNKKINFLEIKFTTVYILLRLNKDNIVFIWNYYK